MKKSELIAHINNNIPLDLLHESVICIINSNPNNAITENRAYYRTHCQQVVEIKFTTRATMQNIVNVYHAIMDEIIVHHGIETAHEIDWGYTPEWARETDAQPAQDAENETETENQTDAENAAEGAQTVEEWNAESDRVHAETSAWLAQIGVAADTQKEEENTMNENNEIRTALDENTAHCKHIAQDIERIAEGGIYTCPECGEMVTVTETEDADGFTAYELSCGHTVEYEPDSVTFYEYFSDVYDIEYRIGSDREYRSVKLMVAYGGPNIYIDTARRAVLLYWWTDYAEYPISSTAADEIDAVFSEIFEC